MAVLSVNKIVKTGLNTEGALAAAAGGGDSWQNTGREYLEVVNGGVGSINVTIAQQNKCNFGVTGSQHDIVVAVPNGERRAIGPIDPSEYNDANGRAQVAYSGVVSVTVGVFAAP